MRVTLVLLAVALAACQIEAGPVAGEAASGIDRSAAEHAAEACRGFMEEAQYLTCTRRAYQTFKGVTFPSRPAGRAAPTPAGDYAL